MANETNIQEQANQWYYDCFGGIDRKEQIERAWKLGGEFASELQDEIFGFTHWATYFELERKEYHLELGGSGRTDTRLVVTTDLRGVVVNADFQLQDIEPWTSAEEQDKDMLITYAKIVALYED